MATDTVIRFVRSPNLAQRMFEDRILVITSSDSMLHRFDEVGTFLWRLLETPTGIDDMAAAVLGEFDGVDKRKVDGEIRGFIEDLRKKNLVVEAPAPEQG